MINWIPSFVRQRVYASRWWNRHRKNRAELEYWAENLEKMVRWYDRREGWRGFDYPEGELRETRFDRRKNAAMSYVNIETKKATYLSDLRLRADAFTQLRVGDIGSGPFPTLLVFDECERVHIDHLMMDYRRIGYPLDDFEARDCQFVSAKSERLPFPDGWFDVLISRNALDHVDDFRATAAEMIRVLAPSGHVHMLINYHRPTQTEPQAIGDLDVQQAFDGVPLRKVYELDAAWGFPDGKSVLWTSLPDSTVLA